MVWRELVFPVRGKSSALSRSAQPEGTTRELRNMRARDERTGGVRGAQRSGLHLWSTVQVNGASPVRALLPLTLANDLIEYQAYDAAGGDPPVVEWTTATPSYTACYQAVKDAAGENVYALDGRANVVKYNNKGQRVARITVTTKEDIGQARALEVDDQFAVYVGITEGGQQSAARLWRFRTEESDKYEQHWEKDVGGFIARIRFAQNRLYVAVNKPDVRQSEIVVLSDLNVAAPSEVVRITAVYPIADIAVAADGSVYSTGPEQDERYINPAYPNTAPVRKLWRVQDLENYRQRWWSSYRASNIDGLGNISFKDTISDQLEILGASSPTITVKPNEILEWRDLSGNGRHLRALDRDQSKSFGPQFREKAHAGLAGVYFVGAAQPAVAASVTNPFTYLRTEANPNAIENSYDLQRTILPCYAGCRYVSFWLIKPDQDEAAGGLPRSLFWQPHNTGHVSGTQIAVDVNTAAPVSGFLSGTARFRQRCSAVGATGALEGGVAQIQSSYATSTRILLITHYHNGTTANGSWVSYYGDRAVRYDAYTALDADEKAARSYLGWNGNEGQGFGGGAAGWIGLNRPYRGHILAIDVFRISTASGLEAQDWTMEEVQQMEGSLMWEYASADLLDGAHAYYITKGPPVRPKAVATSAAHAKTYISSAAHLAKYSPSGDLQWVLMGDDDANGIGGIGAGVEVSGDGALYTVGPAYHNGVGAHYDKLVRKLADNGTSVAYTGSGTWELAGPTAGETWTGDMTRLAVDEENNLYVPWHGNLTARTLHVYHRDGTLMDYVDGIAKDPKGWSVVTGSMPEYGPDLKANAAPYRRAPFVVVSHRTMPIAELTLAGNAVAGETVTIGATAYTWAAAAGAAYTVVVGAGGEVSLDNLRDAINGTGTAGVQYGTGTAKHTQVAAFDGTGTVLRIEPLFGTRATITLAETMTNGSWSTGSLAVSYTDPALTRVNLVDVRPDLLSTPTETRLLAVAGGAIKLVEPGSSIDPGTPASLDPDARYIARVQAYGKAFLADGRVAKYYDPYGNDGEHWVYDWVATGSGEIPRGVRLLSLWNGRIVAVGHDQTDWQVSEWGNPFGWDFKPKTITSKMSVRGSQSKIGAAPDVITALMPYSEDYLLIGGDHSLMLLSGNPASLSPRATLTTVSTKTGVAFGDAWCMDGHGNLYFAGRQGGIYLAAPNGSMDRIDGQIPEDLAAVDQRAYRIDLTWDGRNDGMIVTLVPWSSEAGAGQHWFWERKTNTWSDMTYSSAAHAPHSTATLDGDNPEDRLPIIGHADGYIRAFDPAARDDDGQAINSSVTWWLTGKGDGIEYMLATLDITLASDRQGCAFQVYATDQPDRLGDPVFAGKLSPGRNDGIMVNYRARHLYLRLSSGSPDSSWAFESGRYELIPKARTVLR